MPVVISNQDLVILQNYNTAMKAALAAVPSRTEQPDQLARLTNFLNMTIADSNAALALVTGGGGSLDPDTQALVTYLTGLGVTPSAADQGYYNTLITSLKSAGVWSNLDVYWVFGVSNATAALVNIVNPGTFTATLHNAPTFTAYRGFTGNNSNAYIDTNCILITNTSKMKFDNGFIASRALNTTTAANSAMYGNSGTEALRTRLRVTSAGQLGASLLENTGLLISTVPTKAHYTLSRLGVPNGPWTRTAYQDGSSIGSDGTGPTGVPPTTTTTLLGDLNVSVFGDCQMFSACFGFGLTSTQVAALAAADAAFATSVGALP
jgi:hypothetical protein